MDPPQLPSEHKRICGHYVISAICAILGCYALALLADEKGAVKWAGVSAPIFAVRSPVARVNVQTSSG